MSSDFTRSGLVDFLHHPREMVSPPLLAERWQAAGIVVDCEAPAGCENWHGLSDRIRGAWGRRLLEEHQRRDRHSSSTHRRASAFDVFFSPYHSPTKDELPKPYVIAAESHGATLSAALVVFGIGTRWFAEAVETFLGCLRGGVAVSQQTPDQIPLEASGFRSWQIDHIPVPELRERVVLDFRSPLCLRRGDTLITDFRGILPSVVVRLRGLAKWQGCELPDEREALLRYNESLVYDDLGMKPTAWVRHSRRQPGRAIPMVGFAGKVSIRGPLMLAAPVLALGEMCHAGSHASQGLGRYSIEG